MTSQLRRSRDRDRYHNKDKPDATAVKTMPFGKHKGTPLSQVPQSYIEWCVENIDRSDIRAMLSDEMVRRGCAVGDLKQASKKKTKQKRSPECNDDSATHYAWEDVGGFSHRIPNEVSMAGRELECCPF